MLPQNDGYSLTHRINAYTQVINMLLILGIDHYLTLLFTYSLLQWESLGEKVMASTTIMIIVNS